MDAKGSTHMYPPRVERKIQECFTIDQKEDMSRRLKLELLAEEQERAIEYLKSAPRRKIVEAGRVRATPLLTTSVNAESSPKAAWTLKNNVRRRNVIQKQSLPQLKEDAEPFNTNLSLKSILQHQLSNSNLNQSEQSVPRTIVQSLHKKKEFDSYKTKQPGQSMMYSKSNILKMIFDNEHNATMLEKTGPFISANEATHGSLNFILKKQLRDSNGGLAIGALNESPEAKQAIFARDQSTTSVQFITDDKLSANQGNGS